jgi:hypothetical protein|tara:strand:+ start:252 stop:581 length:330 start_codon:yes stop_codon:yes gene_type:complete
MDYYNPGDMNAEDLIKRVRIGHSTQEFIRTPTGLTIAERAINQYRKGVEEFQKMAMQEWVGSSEEELQHYRKISRNLATPLQLLHWLDAIIADGENAEAIAKHRDSGEI